MIYVTRTVMLLNFCHSDYTISVSDVSLLALIAQCLTVEMLIQRSIRFFLTCHHLYTLIGVMSGPISLNRILHYYTSAYPILSFSFFHYPT